MWEKKGIGLFYSSETVPTPQQDLSGRILLFITAKSNLRWFWLHCWHVTQYKKGQPFNVKFFFYCIWSRNADTLIRLIPFVFKPKESKTWGFFRCTKMDFAPVTANHTRQNSKDFHFLFLFSFEHVQGCVGPHFSVYNIPVPNNPCRKRTVLPSLLRSSAVSLLPGGGGGSETGGEAVETRAMNLVCLPLCLVWFCMGFFYQLGSSLFHKPLWL